MDLFLKVMSMLFNGLSRFFIAYLPRSKCLLISWLQSPSAVILEPKKVKSITVSIVSPSICHEMMAPDPMILVFLMLSFKPGFFSLSSFTFIKRLFSSSSLSATGVVSSTLSEVIDISPSGVGKWQPAPVFLPREFHGQRSMAGYSPWGCQD